jgi:hypothetical protein
LSEDEAYQGDIFIFPVVDFVRIIKAAPRVGGDKRRVYISRTLGSDQRWFLRTCSKFDAITDETCLDVSSYRRNFALLEPASQTAAK